MNTKVTDSNFKEKTIVFLSYEFSIMKKLFYLGNCSTCKRIITHLELPRNIAQSDIKKTPLTLIDLKEMYQRAGSYEALFSRRAKLFHKRQLRSEFLDEFRYQALLLEHYSFLKRPVLIWEDEIFIGSSKTTITQAKNTIHARD